MHNKEFIEVYLRQKGASRTVVKPYPFLWHWLLKSNGKPCLFESPLKLFFKELFLGAAIWGAVMWLILWRLQEPSINYLYMSLLFGFLSGLGLSLEVLYYSRKLKITSSWAEWLKEHDLDE